MRVTPIRTPPVVAGDSLSQVLEEAVTSLENGSVVAITSKIVSICEGSVVRLGSADKETLVQEEAERRLPPDERYNVSLTVKYNLLIANAGIDESNGNGYHVLWPTNPQVTANAVRASLVERFGAGNIGVLIVDSRTTPLRWGVTGAAIAHSGFAAVNDYVGSPDIFGRPFVFEKSNIADGLAASAVVAMGEGSERTPIAVIADIPFVQFQSRNPTPDELDALTISMEDDMYSELLGAVDWQDGGHAR